MMLTSKAYWLFSFVLTWQLLFYLESRFLQMFFFCLSIFLLDLFLFSVALRPVTMVFILQFVVLMLFCS